MLAFQQLSTLPLTATCILIGQLHTRKPSKSCQKLSPTNKKLSCLRGNGVVHGTVRAIFSLVSAAVVFTDISIVS